MKKLRFVAYSPESSPDRVFRFGEDSEGHVTAYIRFGSLGNYGYFPVVGLTTTKRVHADRCYEITIQEIKPPKKSVGHGNLWKGK